MAPVEQEDGSYIVVMPTGQAKVGGLLDAVVNSSSAAHLKNA